MLALNLWFKRSSPLFYAPPLTTDCFLTIWHQTKCRVILTPVFIIVFDALSHGTLGFAFHGSFNLLFQRIWLAVEEFPPIKKWFKYVVTTASKTEGTMWKSIKNCVRYRCRKWPCILFGANHRENKQWYTLITFLEKKFQKKNWALGAPPPRVPGVPISKRAR